MKLAVILWLEADSELADYAYARESNREKGSGRPPKVHSNNYKRTENGRIRNDILSFSLMFPTISFFLIAEQLPDIVVIFKINLKKDNCSL